MDAGPSHPRPPHRITSAWPRSPGARATSRSTASVVPLGDPDELTDGHMEFDREVCAAGIKDFVRPMLFSDQPRPDFAISGELPPDFRLESTHVRVREAAPGIRMRT